MMGQFKQSGPGLIPFFLMLILVLAGAAFLGQVLGQHYLANIQLMPRQGQEQEQGRVASRGDSLSNRQGQNAFREPGEPEGQSGFDQQNETEDPSGFVQQGGSVQQNGSRVQEKKVKVLRLNKEQYYTIVVGTCDHREEALQLGQELGERGLPVIVTAVAPYRVLLGFVNNEEKLSALAQRIRVNEKAVGICCDTLNKVAYKFRAEDAFAAETIAPYLGKISVCLTKGLLLYKNITVADEEMIALRNKFPVLAAELKEVAAEGEKIEADNSGNSAQAAGSFGASQLGTIRRLAELCREWSVSLEELSTQWDDAQLLRSQQQALVLLEEYHRFLASTN